MNNVHKFLNHSAESFKRGDSDRALFWFETARALPYADSAQERIENAEHVIATSLCNCRDVGGLYYDACAGHYPDCPALQEGVRSEWDRILMMGWDAWGLCAWRSEVLAIHRLVLSTATKFSTAKSVVDACPAFEKALRQCFESASRYEILSEVSETDAPTHTVDALRLALRNTAWALLLVLGDVPGLINAQYVPQAVSQSEESLAIADGLVAQVPGWIWEIGRE